MERLDCDRMLVAVLDTGSFVEAARRLGVSPGQASKLVSRLEADLGVQLIKRTTRALAPTEVGQAYCERMRLLLEEFDTLDASVRNASGAPAGRLRLTAPMSFGTIQLVPLLLAFADAFPDIQVEVNFSDRVVNLVDEGFDMAVRVGKPSDSSLISRKLCDARVVVVAAPAYLARRGVPARPEDLAAHECIIDENFRDPSNWRFTEPPSGSPVTMAVTGRLRFSNGEACLAAAEAGFGIARVPNFIAGRSLREGRVQPLLAAWDDASIAIYALYPPARHLALKVRALVDFLAGSFRNGTDWSG
ncbi:LysR family transcriptional regulator [Ancylobacter amanitiformis]|uniref:DNA-binding transcriptional LysR family regulator n=1 Tax=Ancylobacter amanitiformis TaxID=217069 RepID=A0ABU0LUW5_9HYPH|nr:LysR family transcriptional regulator [Ancylobacter amanitiformis]MDQ0512465.1 DNA-binding transcriptional LysR family regulator [Ancylobacter amanitiformis]